MRLRICVMLCWSLSCTPEDDAENVQGGPRDGFSWVEGADVLCASGTNLDLETTSMSPCAAQFDEATLTGTPVSVVVRLVDFSRRSADPNSVLFLASVVGTLNVEFAESRFSWVAGDVIYADGEANPTTVWQAARTARREHRFFSSAHLTVYRFETLGERCGFTVREGSGYYFQEQGRAVPNPGVYISNVVEGCGDPEANTVVHEVGHWLGLDHTFVDECDETLGGDLVNDTPRHTNTDYLGTCEEGGPVDTRDTCPDQAGLDPLRNHMAYTTCGEHFTPGQLERMSHYWTQVLVPIRGR